MNLFQRILENRKFIALIISIATYLIFFGSVVVNKDTVFWGSDIRHKFYPVRVYLYKTITEEHRFPFWTEKIYSGFPIYADSENAYLHPINIVSTILLGPVLAYKFLHFGIYLLGSYGLYLFLKEKNIGLVGYIAANVIYYFSFFFINHQIHQSLIFTMYTFPLSLYLLDRYLTTRQKWPAILNTLVITLAFYWGHPQMLLIYMLGMVIYVAVYHLHIAAFKHLIILGWFVGVLSLPQLIPSMVLSARSYRSADADQINANQGSFHPLMMISLIFPSIFSNDENFQGEDIDQNYSYVETYGYLGISVFVILIWALIFTQDVKIKRYLYLSLFIYIILSYGKFIPFIRLDAIPLINLFRYWTRSIILLAFSLAFFVGNFVDALSKKSVSIETKSYKNVIYYLLPLAVLFLINIDNTLTPRLLQTIQMSIVKSYDLKEWLLIVCISIAFVSVSLRRNANLKLISLFLVLIIFIDLLYFSNNLINKRTDTISSVEHVEIPEAFDNKRVIIEKGEIVNNESLYYKFWWPFGYSQFKDKDYYTYFATNDVTNITQPKAEDLTKDFYPIYKGIGVTNIIFDRNVVELNTNQLDILQADLPGKYLVKNDGHIKFEIEASEAGQLYTFIKAYPGWQAKINNVPVKLIMNKLFISIPINKASKVVELTYVPIHFIIGIIASFFGLILSLFFLLNKHFSIKHK